MRFLYLLMYTATKAYIQGNREWTKYYVTVCIMKWSSSAPHTAYTISMMLNLNLSQTILTKSQTLYSFYYSDRAGHTKREQHCWWTSYLYKLLMQVPFQGALWFWLCDIVTWYYIYYTILIWELYKEDYAEMLMNIAYDIQKLNQWLVLYFWINGEH